MARLGKLPVIISDGATIEVEGVDLTVKGPKGELKRAMPRVLTLDIKEKEIFVNRKSDSKEAKALQGTIRAHISNMIDGVTKGWSKSLEINGPGYRAELKGNDLSLSLGYSHPVLIIAPEGISFKVEKQTVTVEGHDKEVVGLVASRIRASRKPNPYKGTGVIYSGEVIRRKAGKQAAKSE